MQNVVQMEHTIEARCKEYTSHIHLYQRDKSMEAEHSIETDHHINFEEVTALVTATGYMERPVMRSSRSNYTPTISIEIMDLY
jgi:hypothetical protein